MILSIHLRTGFSSGKADEGSSLRKIRNASRFSAIPDSSAGSSPTRD